MERLGRYMDSLINERENGSEAFKLVLFEENVGDTGV